MFSASLTVGDLIDEVIDSVGLYTAHDRSVYLDTFNECISRLYTELIREVHSISATPLSSQVILASLAPQVGAADLRGSDIVGVQAGKKPLRYLPPARFSLCSKNDCVYTLKGDVLLLAYPTTLGNTVSIFYLIRPTVYSATQEGVRIPFPDEFLPLLRARLRGEGYRLANEDTLAAKWLGEYNTLLEEFRLWLASTTAGKEG